MQPEELAKLLAAGYPPIIIDVRSTEEFRAGHIPGALHIPAWRILLRDAPLPASKNIKLVVTCEHGHRAQLVKGLLSALGYQYVTLLDGHMAEWKSSGKPLEK
jgi:hydroxyacylglutathione hydrolase